LEVGCSDVLTRLSEDILFKKVLFYELLQVLPEGPTVDGLVFLAFEVGAVLP